MDVFISYSSKDISMVKKLCEKLKEFNITYWVAFENATIGVQYATSIVNAIDSCDVFLIILSSTSNLSVHVINEVNSAIMRNKQIVPIVIGEVNLSPSMEYYLSSNHMVQFEDNELFYKKIAMRISQVVGKTIGEEHISVHESPVNHSQNMAALLRRAELGDADALFELGNIYKSGNDEVVKDLVKSAEYYFKAAKLGDARAQCNLGWCYEVGEGIDQNWENAFYWYSESAENGCALGQYSLGWMYENGVFIAKNMSEAVRWYFEAAKNGHDISQYKIGCAYMTGEQLVQDFKQANYWFMLASDQGNVFAQYVFAENCYFGRGCEKDIIKAKHMWLLSSERGYVKSYDALEKYYDIFYNANKKTFDC